MVFSCCEPTVVAFDYEAHNRERMSFVEKSSSLYAATISLQSVALATIKELEQKSNPYSNAKQLTGEDPLAGMSRPASRSGLRTVASVREDRGFR